ncbi:MAG: GH32 C-terminal domain-containing protein [Fuerstiella sp.]|nr:GH32 C-terminal domain-containing protein [Fuerstiella sp.]
MNHSIVEFIVSHKHAVQNGSSNEIAAIPRWTMGLALMVCALAVSCPDRAWGETWSLAKDLSYTENDLESTWSYRLDVRDGVTPSFPLLTRNDRDANQIWGSDFATPPRMWSEESGYWCIGRNDTGGELFSSRNHTKWAAGEVLLHPKAGVSPIGLAVGWTSPKGLLVDVRYSFQLASPQSRGIGYSILKRSDTGDMQIVALGNIGSETTNALKRVAVAKGDQLYFRFDSAGDPGGDIVRAAITIEGHPASTPTAPLPAGAEITAGSDFTLTATGDGGGPFQWVKDGQPIVGATAASLLIRNVKKDDAGSYTVRVGSRSSGTAILKVTPGSPRPERYASPVPRTVFSETLAEQKKELKTNELMLRFAESRKRLATDPYRPVYHFTSPESCMNDPNGLCFWQGRWHFFYIAMPPDEFPNPADIIKRWHRTSIGHAVSDDLIHWQDLPYAIHPGIEKACYSGGFLVEKDRVVTFYPGIGAGQMVAIADDPLLLNWDKMGPVNSGMGDSCIWKEGDTYYGLVGRSVWTSKDLAHWQGRGGFLTSLPFIRHDDEGSCPEFRRIGDKYILSFFSHANGGQYFLGDYDKTHHRFTPYHHARFNHGTVAPGGVHAPRMGEDGKGGLFNILNFNHGKHSDDWDQVMSLPQRLTLGPDKLLRIEPIAAAASLRGKHQHVGETVIPANKEIVLKGIEGNTMELEVEIDPKNARWVQLNVLRSPGAEEQTSITFYNHDKRLAFWYDTPGRVVLDGSRSSTLPDVWLRPPEQVVTQRGGQPLRLRVFVDRSVVEVFVNERQYLAMRVYPGREDSIGVSLRAQGQDAMLKKLNSWQLKSIWTTRSDTK